MLLLRIPRGQCRAHTICDNYYVTLSWNQPPVKIKGERRFRGRCIGSRGGGAGFNRYAQKVLYNVFEIFRNFSSSQKKKKHDKRYIRQRAFCSLTILFDLLHYQTCNRESQQIKLQGMEYVSIFTMQIFRFCALKLDCSLTKFHGTLRPCQRIRVRIDYSDR